MKNHLQSCVGNVYIYIYTASYMRPAPNLYNPWTFTTLTWAKANLETLCNLDCCIPEPLLLPLLTLNCYNLWPWLHGHTSLKGESLHEERNACGQDPWPYMGHLKGESLDVWPLPDHTWLQGESVDVWLFEEDERKEMHAGRIPWPYMAHLKGESLDVWPLPFHTSIP